MKLAPTTEFTEKTELANGALRAVIGQESLVNGRYWWNELSRVRLESQISNQQSQMEHRDPLTSYLLPLTSPILNFYSYSERSDSLTS